MRFKKHPAQNDEADLTPMIDMTFQLIAFFMVLINFTEAEASDKIKLPDSDLARPPESVPDFRVMLSVIENGQILYNRQLVEKADLLEPYLTRELGEARAQRVETAKIKVIIRGHRDAKMGAIQDVMEVCRNLGLEDFTFRVGERLRATGPSRFIPSQ